MRFSLPILFLLAACHFVQGQVIFAPVAYQYGDQTPFYYGGANPQVLAHAAEVGEFGWGRVGGYAFCSGTISHFRQVSHEPLRTYCDRTPFEIASIYGYTANDVRNAAYAAVPTYFRKADLLSAAMQLGDHSIGKRPLPQIDVSANKTAVADQRGKPLLIFIPKGMPIPTIRSNNSIIFIRAAPRH